MLTTAPSRLMQSRQDIDRTAEFCTRVACISQQKGISALALTLSRFSARFPKPPKCGLRFDLWVALIQGLPLSPKPSLRVEGISAGIQAYPKPKGVNLKGLKVHFVIFCTPSQLSRICRNSFRRRATGPEPRTPAFNPSGRGRVEQLKPYTVNDAVEAVALMAYGWVGLGVHEIRVWRIRFSHT